MQSMAKQSNVDEMLIYLKNKTEGSVTSLCVLQGNVGL